MAQNYCAVLFILFIGVIMWSFIRRKLLFLVVFFSQKFGCAPKTTVPIAAEVAQNIAQIDNLLALVPTDVVSQLVDLVAGNNVSVENRDKYKQVLDTTFSIATLVYKLNK